MQNKYDNLNDPSEIELVECKFLLPKDLVAAFENLGIEHTGKQGHASVSKRLARYLLKYHKLFTRRDVATLELFLDLPEITKKLKDYDAAKNTN